MLRWKSLFPNRLTKGVRRKRRNQYALTRRLTAEPLEDRRMLAVLTVNSTGDDTTAGNGLVTLREAIIAANTDGTTDLGQTGSGPDEIRFDGLAAGQQTINIGSALPDITETLTIDGYVNRAGATPNTSGIGSAINASLEIIINGGGGAYDGFRIVAGADGSIIRGLVINNFGGDGVEINNASNNTVEGNFIGTNAAGTAGVANATGVAVLENSLNNTIGGTAASDRNLISGNSAHGVFMSNAASLNFVRGNFIGTQADGTSGLGNGGNGVWLNDAANSNTVGGPSASFRNVIAANNVGVRLNTVSGNLVQGNYIGVDRTGAADLGNTLDGVVIEEGSTNNTVGGTTTGARNIISGNNSDGVQIQDSGTSGNVVRGNYIGTDAAGNTDLGNSSDGVHITSGATNNTIGGTTAGTGNVISGNDDEGVEINGATTTGNMVQGNFIGTEANGTDPLGNSTDGVEIVDAANNLVGGTAPGAGNVIAHNGTEGVEVAGTPATGNAIQRNSMFNNGTLGIDLSAQAVEGDGVTANDFGAPADDDEGANRLQNFPVFSGSATLLGDSIALTYSVPTETSNAAYPLDVEFFIADSANQEGQTYFASDTYVAGEAEMTKFVTLPAQVALTNLFVVATATDNAGNTSEFSNAVQIETPIILGSPETVVRKEWILGFEEDYFQYTAHDTGKLIVRTHFLHAVVDIDLELFDQFGNLIAFSMNSSPTQDFEEIIIPVVTQEDYFIRVTTNMDDDNNYDYTLEIENFPAPIPEMPVLHPDDDDGASGTDNITSVDTPRILVQADLADFAAMGIDILTSADAAGGVTDGAAVEVFVNGVSQGFANAVGASNTLFQFQLGDDVLDDGIPIEEGTLNFVSAAVRIFDGQGDAAGSPAPATGRTLLSKQLELISIEAGAQIGTWAAGTVLIDTNGNFKADPYAAPLGQSDTTYRIGFDSDYIFAGKFNVNVVPMWLESVGDVGTNEVFAYATEFDTIAAYGLVGGNVYRWLIDINGNGVIDPVTEIFFEPTGQGINGYPVAGNFDGNAANGDEVGLFDGRFWYLDTNHNFNVSDETPIEALDYSGFPIAGDFDGDTPDMNGGVPFPALVDVDNDGDDDVATYIATSSGGNLFSVDENKADPGDPILIDGVADFSFQVGSPNTGGFGFAGVRERPVAADFNDDGIDDFGLWVPDGIVPVPNELSEWFLLLSGNDPFTDKWEVSVLDRIIDDQGNPVMLNGFVPFSPEPFGNDIYAQFGNTFSLPIAGEFNTQQTFVFYDVVTEMSTGPPEVAALVVEQMEPPPVVEESNEPAPPTVAALNQEPVAEQPLQQEVVLAAAKVTTEVASVTAVQTANEMPASPAANQVAQQSPTEAVQATTDKTPETMPEQTPPLEPVIVMVEEQVVVPETPTEVVVEQAAVESGPQTLASIEAGAVKETKEASVEETPVAPVDPPVQPRSRSRVRSLSFGSSRPVVKTSSLAVPLPVVQPAELHATEKPIESQVVVQPPVSATIAAVEIVEQAPAPPVPPEPITVEPKEVALVESASAPEVIVITTEEIVEPVTAPPEKELAAIDAALAEVTSLEISQPEKDLSENLAQQQSEALQLVANQIDEAKFSGRRYRALRGFSWSG